MATHPLWRPFEAGANAARQAQRLATRQTEPDAPRLYDAIWREQFEVINRLLATALGGLLLDVRHVGSTAIPGVVAKPVIDVDLIVPDVEDESRYLPGLEAAGFRLIFRDEMGGDAHRHLTFAEPNTNLHVWSPDAIEPQRHLIFADWLRTNSRDRELYSSVKLDASAAKGATRYNDVKAAVVYDIYEGALLADAQHEHDPRPRRSSLNQAERPHPRHGSIDPPPSPVADELNAARHRDEPRRTDGSAGHGQEG